MTGSKDEGRFTRFRHKLHRWTNRSHSHQKFDGPRSSSSSHNGDSDASADAEDESQKKALKIRSILASIEDSCIQGSQHYLQLLVASADAHESSSSDSDDDHAGGTPQKKDRSGTNEDDDTFEDEPDTLEKVDMETLTETDAQHLVEDSRNSSAGDIVAAVAGLNSSVNDKTMANTLANVTHQSRPEAEARAILQIPDDEEIDKQMSGWFVRDVMIQGQLYSTNQALYFLAHLPLPCSAIIKEGSLRRWSTKLMRFTKSWYVLRQNSFSFFTSAAEKFIPVGSINLAKAKYAAIETSQGGGPATSFKIELPEGTVTLKADSASSAHEWAKAIQKEIFRQRNQGETVRIRLPWAAISLETFREVMFNTYAMHLAVIEDAEKRRLTDYLFAFFFRESEESESLEYFTRCIDNWGARGAVVYTDQKEVVLDISKIRKASQLRDSTYTDGAHYHRVSAELPQVFVVPTGLSYDHHDEGADKNQNENKNETENKNGNKNKNRNENENVNVNENGNENETAVGEKSEKPVSPDAIFEHILSDEFVTTNTEIPASKKVTSGSQTYTVIQRPGSASASDTASDTDHNILQSMAGKLVDIHEDVQHHAGTVKAKVEAKLPDPQGVVHTVRRQVQEELNRLHTTSPSKQERILTDDLILEDPPSCGRNSEDSCGSQSEVDPVEPTVHLSQVKLDNINKRHRDYFSLGDRVSLIATFLVHFSVNGQTYYGKLYVSNQYLTFRRLGISVKDLRVLLPLEDILTISPSSRRKTHREAARLAIRGHSPMFASFKSTKVRDHFIMAVRGAKAGWDTLKCKDSKEAVTEENLLELNMKSVRAATYEEMLSSFNDIAVPPILLDPLAKGANETFLVRPLESLRVTMLTIGSRGDVQPYIALAQGLMKEGHECKIATHEEFRKLVEDHGIKFAPIAGNPDKLMKIMIEHGSFSVSFLRDAYQKFKDWVEELLDTAWEACQDTDLLIESPSAMAGLHIAEALRIPYFRAFTMPWTRTKVYPHAFLVSDQKLGSSYNYMSYVMFDNMFWRGISGKVNRWRQKLGLRKTSLDEMHQQQVPFLYNVSPAVLTPTIDAPDWVHVTGYWFVEPDTSIEPDPELVKFIKRAKDDGKKLVYIGFGSIIVPDPAEMTRSVIEGVEQAGVRCVLAKGWSCHGKDDDDDSSRESNSESSKEKKQTDEERQKADAEIEFPDSIFQVDSVPHDWLFPQVDAAVHHGGSGTTGASLRQGLPTIIKPFFGDQFFYAKRIEDIGCGINLAKLTGPGLAKALKTAVGDEKLIAKAAAIGEQIQHEHGVNEAIFAIYRELSYARSLIRGPPSVSPSRAAKITAHVEAMANEHPHHPHAERGRRSVSRGISFIDTGSSNVSRSGSQHRPSSGQGDTADPVDTPSGIADIFTKPKWPFGKTRGSETKV